MKRLKLFYAKKVWQLHFFRAGEFPFPLFTSNPILFVGQKNFSPKIPRFGVKIEQNS
jgi:hypothetical protein